jgi:hypothetical protein
MRNKLYVLSMALLVASLLALPGVARSAMWVGGEVGGTFSQEDLKISSGDFKLLAGGANVAPAVIGGVTIGYDFVNAGFGGYAWPDWMKYFFFATDFTYNRNVFPNQTFDNVTVNGINVGQATIGRVEGYMAAWTFLFAFHYGMMPDSEVPAGRIHPYIGVGPAILFSGVNVKGLGSQSSINPALVVEAGIRWMCLKNVSVDTAFRYRYASPTYAFVDSFGDKADVNASVNNFSFLLRANYHF